MNNKWSKAALVVSFLMFFAFLATSQETANSGLKCYSPSQAFQQNEDPDCFIITQMEADLAFKKGCWEDAAKLYRAAKLCRDATQANRATMNTRIEACSDAAEKELQDERDKAVRQARQLIASKRAIDARELLRQNDRTTAYRLAQFANEYIAPEDEQNPDCLHAILDAWQQRNPSATGNIQPILPFCYELIDLQDDSMSVRFINSKNELRLFAFSPKRHELYEWAAPHFELISTIKVDTFLKEFDISPDGETLVFSSRTTFMLRKNGKNQYITEVPDTRAWCFSADGKVFFYFNKTNMTLQSIFIDDYFVQQRDKKNTKGAGAPVVQRNSSTRIGHIPTQLAHINNHIWVVGQDSIFFYQSINEKSGRSGWSLFDQQPLLFGMDTANTPALNQQFPFIIDRKTQVITKIIFGAFTQCHINWENNGYKAKAGAYQTGTLLADEMVWQQADDDQISSKIYLQRTPNLIHSIHHDGQFGATWYRNGSLAYTQGNIQPEPAWLAISGNGALRLWRLQGNFSSKNTRLFRNPTQVLVSRNGEYIANLIPGKPIEIIKGDKALGPGAIFSGTAEDFVSNGEISNTGWIAVTASPNNELQLIKGEKKWTLGGTEFINPVFKFDLTGSYFAFVTDIDSIVVVQLLQDSFKWVSGRRIGHQNIYALCFIPGQSALMVQRFVYEGGSPALIKGIYRPVIWHFTKGDEAPLEYMRLEGYLSHIIETDYAGQNLYLSDGFTVKIFGTDNLTSEKMSLREKRGLYIHSVAIHPFESLIGIAYSDGNIAFFDSDTGKKLFQLTAEKSKQDQQPWDSYTISFSLDGEKIIAVIDQQSIQIFDLNLERIRQQIALKGGQLIAFAPEQIGEWDLDKALGYEGNFNKLSRSGDIPLIRAFFNFYQQQALATTNIKNTKDFCEKAAQLYHLFDAESKKAQKPVLLFMYKDYLWKLLQRKEIDAAMALIKNQSLEPGFRNDLAFLGSSAHIAVLKNNFKEASQLYLDWMAKYERETDHFTTEYITGYYIFEELEQLHQYGYLDADQRSFACAFFKNYNEFSDDFCSGAVTVSDLKSIIGNESTWYRWNIFQLLLQAKNNYQTPFVTQLARLKDAVGFATQLSVSRKIEGRIFGEAISIESANCYRNMGRFEAGLADEKSISHFTEAIAQVNAAAAFSKENTARRLELLASLYLERGNALLLRNPNQAIEDYRRCYDMAIQIETLKTEKNEDTNPVYFDYFAPSLSQYAKALLILGRPQEALPKFEEADQYLNLPANDINIGHVYTVLGQRTEALLAYGSIDSEQTLSQAMADLRLYATPLLPQPHQYQRVIRTIDTLKQAFLANRPYYNSAVIDYNYYAALERQFTRLGQLDSALYYSHLMLQVCTAQQRNVQQSNAYPTDWQANLLSAAVSYTQNQLLVNFKNNDELKNTLAMATTILDNNAGNFSSYWNLLLLNTGHLQLMLGNKEKALSAYHTFDIRGGSGSFAYFDYLLKDWRDYARQGAQLTGLKDIVQEIFPEDYPFTSEEQRIINQ